MHFIEYFNHAKVEREGTSGKNKGNVLKPMTYTNNDDDDDDLEASFDDDEEEKG